MRPLLPLHFRPRSITRVAATLFTLCSVLVLAACSSTPTYNPTTFPYQIDEEKVSAKPIKKVVIAHVNLGAPSRNYLEKQAERIDASVARYLKDNGYKVLSQRLFKQEWNTAVRVYGNPVDPTSGKVNMKAFAQIMHSVRDAMASSGVDAFIFTDLIEFKVPFSGGLKHLARWDGVTRKPTLQGPGEGVTADFDWNMQAAVASLQVSIYDTELKALFLGRGGIDATDAIDTRSSTGRFIRRRSILENSNYIEEGVKLALHPFIVSPDWPGNPD